MNIRDFTALAHELGAIAAYAYLGDVGESPTGDKKAQKFEDEYLEELFDTLADCGFSAVTYMPTRNTREQLDRLMRMCHDRDLFEISGEDINSPRQSFICPALEDPAYAHLRKATYALRSPPPNRSPIPCFPAKPRQRSRISRIGSNGMP